MERAATQIPARYIRIDVLNRMCTQLFGAGQYEIKAGMWVVELLSPRELTEKEMKICRELSKQPPTPDESERPPAPGEGERQPMPDDSSEDDEQLSSKLTVVDNATYVQSRTNADSVWKIPTRAGKVDPAMLSVISTGYTSHVYSIAVLQMQNAGSSEEVPRSEGVDQTVALKVLNNGSMTRQFYVAESQAFSRLSSVPIDKQRYIVELLADPFTLGRDSVFLMPLASSTLGYIFHSESPFADRTGLWKGMSDLSNALEALALADITHNDINPNNVLVFMDSSNEKINSLKLSDFGHSVQTSTATMFDESEQLKMYRSTGSYSAPEVFNSTPILWSTLDI
ncbi:MAG: hypothetical protein M1822_003694 [Bathelium mastoideum]|nr:MAG: hypothetical protein M1822_003694 [Bathelium mastoideum]